MRQCLKDTGFRWPQKPPNASEVKFNRWLQSFSFFIWAGKHTPGILCGTI
jgi:hypothetical protein